MGDWQRYQTNLKETWFLPCEIMLTLPPSDLVMFWGDGAVNFQRSGYSVVQFFNSFILRVFSWNVIAYRGALRNLWNGFCLSQLLRVHIDTHIGYELGMVDSLHLKTVIHIGKLPLNMYRNGKLFIILWAYDLSSFYT